MIETKEVNKNLTCQKIWQKGCTVLLTEKLWNEKWVSID